MGDVHEMKAGPVSAMVAAKGAELTAFSDAGGPLLWDAGPQWPRHAPVLFPIIGRLADDALYHDGQRYRMTQHGFARDRVFTFTERDPRRTVLRLTESDATLASFPFRFTLSLIYDLDERGLTVTTIVENPADRVLPCSVGAHPAFRWPLVPGVPKDRHDLVFERPENGPMLVLDDGLVARDAPWPARGETLRLDEALFADDALILRDVESRSVTYAARGEGGETLRSLTMSWSGYSDLGIWSKPSGADFLCIEPWYGTASPKGWQGELTEKPGLVLIEPGGRREFVWRVAL